jgi:alpha-L-rhamnosidase
MNSFNHYAFGAVGAWMYATIGGIQLDSAQPGYKHIIIRPQPLGSRLTRARAALRSMYGRIESSWRIDGTSFSLDVTIPANTTATVHMPGTRITEDGRAFEDAAPIDVGAGCYAFRSTLG